MEKNTKAESKKKDAKKSPVKTIRHGAMMASIWEKVTQTGLTYYDYSLSRCWKRTNSDQFAYSQNYFDRNLEQLVQCATEASAWIAENSSELESTPADQSSPEPVQEQAAA